MARDFEDVNDIDDLSDDELRGLVREHLASDSALDIDDLTINVEDGHVILDGRVGTDEERRIAEHIVTDVLGVEDYENNIFVDPMRRATSPEAADDNLADEDATEGRLLGDRPVSLESGGRGPPSRMTTPALRNDRRGSRDRGRHFVDSARGADAGGLSRTR